MLKEIKIRNFKCFNNIKTIKLNHLTILAGGNGVGKSSVIQSLLFFILFAQKAYRSLNT